MRVYLVEITAIVDEVGTAEVFRFSDQGFTTEPTDTPANAHYEARLKQPALVRRDMFRSGSTWGQGQAGVGELVLSNQDGELDVFATYGLDGQPVRMLVGEDSAGYASFTEALVGTMDQVEVTSQNLTVRVRDRQAELQTAMQTHRYDGTGNLEGTGIDIKGRVKPLLYGKVFNLSPILVNSNLFIYQVAANPIEDVSAVYDQGVALGRGADYADEAALLATPPAAGEYRALVGSGGGWLRLGSRPVGLLTCDAAEYELDANNSCAQIIRRIALQTGLTTADLNDASIDQLDLINASPCGLWIGEERSANDCMDALSASVGAYYGFDRLGKFRVGRLQAPSGSAVVVLDDVNLLKIEQVAGRESSSNLPVHRVKVDYARVYTLQDQSTLAASVSASRMAELGQEYRTAVSTNESILLKHVLSPEMTRQTCLIHALDAQAEADRLLALYSVRRGYFDATVRLEPELLALLDIGVTVQIDYWRFGLSGKNLLVIGLEIDLKNNRANLSLWG